MTRARQQHPAPGGRCYVRDAGAHGTCADDADDLAVYWQSLRQSLIFTVHPGVDSFIYAGRIG
jgi:hypothetical protein